jgi:hypothetical protein
MTDDPMYPGWKRIKTHDQYMDVVAKERKVIEAAKALEVAKLAEAKAVVEPEEIWAATHYALRKAEQSLTAAVRALQAAEKEDKR